MWGEWEVRSDSSYPTPVHGVNITCTEVWLIFSLILNILHNVFMSGHIKRISILKQALGNNWDSSSIRDNVNLLVLPSVGWSVSQSGTNKVQPLYRCTKQNERHRNRITYLLY